MKIQTFLITAVARFGHLERAREKSKAEPSVSYGNSLAGRDLVIPGQSVVRKRAIW
jgi:hypothetical protein